LRIFLADLKVFRAVWWSGQCVCVCVCVKVALYRWPGSSVLPCLPVLSWPQQVMTCKVLWPDTVALG
jgi:hypothetical protein